MSAADHMFVLGPTDAQAVTAFALEKAGAHLLGESDRFTLEEEWESLEVWQRASGCVFCGRHPLLAREISREFACTVLCVGAIENANIYSWQGDLFQSGDYIDRHWSCPEVHGVPELPRNRARYLETFRGVPGAFAAAFHADPAMVALYLTQLVAGGWAWLDLLRRTGYGDLAEACSDPPDRTVERALNGKALWNAWAEEWRPPATKPDATMTGEEHFRAERHLNE